MIHDTMMTVYGWQQEKKRDTVPVKNYLALFAFSLTTYHSFCPCV